MKSDVGAAPESTRILWHRLIDYYHGQGVPRPLLDKGCISADEAEELATVLSSVGAKRVLEIGTFIGVSTLVLAAAAGARGEVFTIDPGFPLFLQTTEFGVSDPRECTSLARAAAAVFGCEECIRFCDGYCSRTPGAEMRRRLTRYGIDWRTPRVAAADVLAWGEIDFAFIDGEHSASAIASDLALVTQRLRPHGVVALHDLEGYWGARVRSGITRFLRHHPGFVLTVRDNLGFLSRA